MLRLLTRVRDLLAAKEVSKCLNVITCHNYLYEYHDVMFFYDVTRSICGTHDFKRKKMFFKREKKN